MSSVLCTFGFALFIFPSIITEKNKDVHIFLICSYIYTGRNHPCRLEIKAEYFLKQDMFIIIINLEASCHDSN